MFDKHEIAKFPMQRKDRFDGQSLAKGEGWVTDGIWAVRCSEEIDAADRPIASRLDEYVERATEPVREQVRVPWSRERAKVPKVIGCVTCGGTGQIECPYCGSDADCPSCEGAGERQVGDEEVEKIDEGARWYALPDGSSVILSDRLAEAILDGRDLELFGSGPMDPIIGKMDGEAVAVIMPLRSTPHSPAGRNA